MTGDAWQLCTPDLADDDALGRAVLAVHEAVLGAELAGDPMVNVALPVQVRAVRRIEGWRVMLLLTPWMLSRLLFPDEAPVAELPDGWTADARLDAGYVVLGPGVTFQLLGQPQRGHVNYHPALGHYLLQPICLDTSPYRDAEEAFEAWNRVIRIRDENMENARRDCRLQKEVSRREFFHNLQRSGEN